MEFVQSSIIVLVVAGLVVGEAPYPSSDVHSNQGGASGPYAAAPALSPAPASAPPPAPSYSKWEHDNDQTISLQSGYEGYLVPAEPSLSVGDILRTAGLITLAPPLGKLGIKFALKFGVWFLGFAALFLIGSFVTTAVCTLTPLCTISFIGLGPFTKESVRSLVSEERLNSATHFVAEAINKYRNLNKKNGDDKNKR